jgi:hypothetical protein
LAGSFDIVDSENEPCLWVSDWLSAEIRGWQINQAQMSAAYERIKDRLHFLSYDADGIKVGRRALGGPIETTFPDLPRPIPEPPTADLSVESGAVA